MRGKHQEFGHGVGEIGATPGPCCQDGQRGQKRFSWTISHDTVTAASVPYVSFSAPVMRVRQHRLGAQDQPICPRHRAVTPGEARLGWGLARGRGGARGGCATAGTRSSLGSARRKWLGASAVAMHTLKGGGQRLRLGSLFGESGWIFCLPHSQPFPPPAAWGPLGYSQSRGSLMPFHPFCYSASPFCCSASQEEEGTGRHPCTLHLKPKGRAGVFSVMSGKQLNRLINQQEGYQQDGVFNEAGFQQVGAVGVLPCGGLQLPTQGHSQPLEEIPTLPTCSIFLPDIKTGWKCGGSSSRPCFSSLTGAEEKHKAVPN